jgi:Glycosyl transferase family 2
LISPTEVSVVIPTRDRWRFARSAVGMALEQEGVAVEVVVVDDGSTDETAERLATWRNPRLRVLRRAGGHGVSAARNSGIAEAQGEWVALLDDDDLWSPSKLRLQLEAARAENADWAYASAAVVDQQRNLVWAALPAPPARDIDLALRSHNVIPGGCSNVIARTALLRSVGGFDENLAVFADWDLWVRLASAARAAAVSDVLVAYTEHEGNMHVTGASRMLAEARYLADKLRSSQPDSDQQLDWGVVSRFVALAYARAGKRYEGIRIAAEGAFRHGAPRNLALALKIAVRGGGARPRRDAGASPAPWLARYRDTATSA